MNSIYREEILDHYKHPQNFGKLSKFSSHARQINPFCGDEIEVFLDVQDGKVTDISFYGKGCVISIASASLLTEFAKNKPTFSLTKFDEKDMLGLLGVAISGTRKKCALLPLASLKECLYAKV